LIQQTTLEVHPEVIKDGKTEAGNREQKRLGTWNDRGWEHETTEVGNMKQQSWEQGTQKLRTENNRGWKQETIEVGNRE
jgi:hypothetical protein